MANVFLHIQNSLVNYIRCTNSDLSIVYTVDEMQIVAIPFHILFVSMKYLYVIWYEMSGKVDYLDVIWYEMSGKVEHVCILLKH